MSDWMLNHELYKAVKQFKIDHPGVLEAQTEKRKAEEAKKREAEGREQK